ARAGSEAERPWRPVTATSPLPRLAWILLLDPMTPVLAGCANRSLARVEPAGARLYCPAIPLVVSPPEGTMMSFRPAGRSLRRRRRVLQQPDQAACRADSDFEATFATIGQERA